MSGNGKWVETILGPVFEPTAPVTEPTAPVTAGATGPVPDDVIDAVKSAIRQADYECEMAESVQMPFGDWTEHQARAAIDAYLSVPAVAAVFARDTQVRAAWAAWNVNWRSDSNALLADTIAALYAEDGAR